MLTRHWHPLKLVNYLPNRMCFFYCKMLFGGEVSSQTWMTYLSKVNRSGSKTPLTSRVSADGGCHYAAVLYLLLLQLPFSDPVGPC